MMNFRAIAKAISATMNEIKMFAKKDEIDTEEVASIVVTVAVGSYLDLPSGRVDSIDEYYIAHVFPVAEAIVGGLNEGYMPVDVMKTMRAIKAYYGARYKMVFEATSKEALEATWNVLHNTNGVSENTERAWMDIYKANDMVPTLMKKVVDAISSNGE